MKNPDDILMMGTWQPVKEMDIAKYPVYPWG